MALAYVGATDQADLAQVFTDAGLLHGSVNYQLLAEGLVYPTFYSQLYPDLRAELTAAAGTARDAKEGVWASDATTSGATITAVPVALSATTAPSSQVSHSPRTTSTNSVAIS